MMTNGVSMKMGQMPNINTCDSAGNSSVVVAKLSFVIPRDVLEEGRRHREREREMETERSARDRDGD
jgi:hypothetical protein